MTKELLVYVNDTPVTIPQGSTVIIACERVGVIVPRFCYHDLLEIAGNCRICLVEIEGSPKPNVSCSLPIINNIKIYTETPLVKKAREGVIEFLLLNHPLDCPICDQGGECDLQNQANKYGSTYSRFYKYKRGVEDKGFGPIIKTIITRCIHCTRCIRFSSDIGGVEDLGTSLRGNITEVGTYVKKTLNSEISGNLIDLCPVGALTSRVYAFKARPWEVDAHKTIDTSDCLGSNTIVERKKSKVLRVMPRNNKFINLEWLSDKSRYAYEGNTRQRLAFPYYKFT
jgi:NADH dehydrogenase (ubiquinone) Fe-S protein 1